MTTLQMLAVEPIIVDTAGMSYRGQTYLALAKLGVPAAALLAAVQTFLRGKVDATAENLRTALLTPGAGQAMEYQEAQAEAEAALAAGGTPTPAAYPMLAASIGLDVDPSTGAPAADVLGVARSVQARVQAWLTLGAAIRGARLHGKAAIDAALTVEAAAAAVDAIAWPKLPS